MCFCRHYSRRIQTPFIGHWDFLPMGFACFNKDQMNINACIVRMQSQNQSWHDRRLLGQERSSLLERLRTTIAFIISAPGNPLLSVDCFLLVSTCFLAQNAVFFLRCFLFLPASCRLIFFCRFRPKILLQARIPGVSFPGTPVHVSH